ncbi:MAG: sugar transferase [Desulfobacterales bacterium]|nr:sugar transferase [Desulfobacterales bacterium]
MKRLFDVVSSFIGLLVMSPVLIVFIFLIWRQDYKSPFYIASRVGRFGRSFKMVKLRSMVANADKSGVNSTSGDDMRITRVGHLIRRYKLDEFSQLWNVLMGQMSLVGPRPQVKQDVDLYTKEERHLLDACPGITALASIVFSDEGDILAGSKDPDLRYNQVIRPWKSRLGLLYINKRTFLLDIYIILLTIAAILSRPLALRGVQGILQSWNADERLIKIARRDESLYSYPPPGTDSADQGPPRRNKCKKDLTPVK